MRVARFSAFAIAFFPSLVLWSSQGLKDGPIVFFLAVSILATLRLGEKFSIKYVAILTFSLFLILTFRFYVFYMIVAAVGGSFLMGMQKLSASDLVRQFAVLSSSIRPDDLGVTRYATCTSVLHQAEGCRRVRNDAAKSAKSGFGQDIDVSTGEGAIKQFGGTALFVVRAHSLATYIAATEYYLPERLFGGRLSLTYSWDFGFSITMISFGRQISPVLTF